MQSTEQKTILTAIYKSHDGWHGKSEIKDVNGYDWHIMSYKSGKYLVSNAQGGKVGKSGNFDTFSYVIFQDPSHQLIKISGRCTEKSITEVHNQGIEKFKELFSL